MGNWFALFGGRLQAVKEKIAAMNQDYNRTIKELQDELSRLNNETEMLREKISALKVEIETYRSMAGQVSEILLQAHLDASEQVYLSRRRAEELKADAGANLSRREQEREILKKTVSRLTEEMQSVASGYSKALEVLKDEPSHL